jgi:hypothetical protein
MKISHSIYTTLSTKAAKMSQYINTKYIKILHYDENPSQYMLSSEPGKLSPCYYCLEPQSLANMVIELVAIYFTHRIKTKH